MEVLHYIESENNDKSFLSMKRFYPELRCNNLKQIRNHDNSICYFVILPIHL